MILLFFFTWYVVIDISRVALVWYVLELGADIYEGAIVFRGRSGRAGLLRRSPVLGHVV